MKVVKLQAFKPEDVYHAVARKADYEGPIVPVSLTTQDVPPNTAFDPRQVDAFHVITRLDKLEMAAAVIGHRGDSQQIDIFTPSTVDYKNGTFETYFLSEFFTSGVGMIFADSGENFLGGWSTESRNNALEQFVMAHYFGVVDHTTALFVSGSSKR